jgi:hypothetical protein
MFLDEAEERDFQLPSHALSVGRWFDEDNEQLVNVLKLPSPATSVH